MPDNHHPLWRQHLNELQYLPGCAWAEDVIAYIAELQKDKSRLDWIEASKNPPQFGRASKNWFCCYPPVGDMTDGSESAREAIDAAMSQSEKQESR
jgi:hypothetical protein